MLAGGPQYATWDGGYIILLKKRCCVALVEERIISRDKVPDTMRQQLYLYSLLLPFSSLAIFVYYVHDRTKGAHQVSPVLT